jgi:chromosome segregation ATPase
MVVKSLDKEMLTVLSSLLDEKLNPIKEDISTLKEDVLTLKEDVSGLKRDVSVLKEDVKFIKVQQKEQGRILRILEDKAITNKAEHDKISNEIVHLSEKVENMRKDLATVEVVTARNMENIARLKVIK